MPISWGAQAGGEAGDRQRRGVAGEDAVLAAQGFELVQQALFDRQVLDDGFDDQARGRERIEGFHRLQAGADGFALGGWQLAFFHQPAELPVDA
jgi:hypothetical protein